MNLPKKDAKLTEDDMTRFNYCFNYNIHSFEF